MRNILSFFLARKIYVLFLVVVMSGLVIVFLATTGRYPIAFVNGDVITLRRLVQNYQAATLYYEGALKVYGADRDVAQYAEAQDIETAVFTQLVEASLVAKGAREEAGRDLPRLVDEKVKRYDGDASLREAAESVYRMWFGDFKREVLVPQAKRDVLAGRLYLKGETFDAWLENAKRSANVVVLSNRFYWDGEKIGIRQ